MQCSVRRAVGVFFCLVGIPATARAEGPLPVAAAVKPATVLQAAISPDGRHVAAIAYNGTNGGLLLLRTDDFSSKMLDSGRWASYGFDRYLKMPRRVTWVNSELMAVDYGLEAEARDLSGRKVSELGTTVIGKARAREPESPLLLVFEDKDLEEVALVDARTGSSKRLRVPMSGTPRAWAFDEQGELRAVTMSSSSFWSDTTKLSHWYRSPLTEQWEKLLDFKVSDENWRPLAVDAAGNRLIVLTREGRDTSAVFAHDPAKRALGEMMAGHPSEDLYVPGEVRSDQYDSVVTHGMKPARHWFNARWAALQASIDQAMPNHVNHMSGNPEGLVLVHSYADIDPGRWYLLDTRKMSLRLLLETRPQIKPEQMRPMGVIRYAAKDGLPIPAYLTLPTGEGKRLPMVVMVHGGPAARDVWAWDAEVQLLATRGYAVFQPQFRGSAGFGKAFEKAGDGQWGLAMQDDITAGVEHLIQQGIADPQRICIYGASYGGYAALWGLIKTPQLYRCGITLAGVSDIGERLTDWSDTNEDKASRELLRFHLTAQDPVKLAQVSPLKNAHRVQAPLLIAHGELDRRVPIGHSKRMMRALDNHQKPYEWLELEDDGHSIRLVRNRYRFDSALLKFVERHIGPVPPAAPAAVASAPK